MGAAALRRQRDGGQGRWLANQARGRTGIIARWLLNGSTAAALMEEWMDGCGQHRGYGADSAM